MDAVLERFVRDAGNQARQQLEQFGALTVQNTLWAGTPDYSTRITDAELATVEDFASAGLTDTVLTDAIYALEQVRLTLNNAMAALAVLSQV